jgi:7-cyano-7-deazaguanine synthase
MSVLIVSGGMDSTTMLHAVVKQYEVGVEHLAITFDYGQTLDREIECAKWQCEKLSVPHRVIDLRSFAKSAFAGSALTGSGEVPDLQAVLGVPQPPTYVPNRNTIFVEIATAIAEAGKHTGVYIGVQLHDVYGYWDTTPEWLDAINLLHQLNRGDTIQVYAPFVRFSKSAELRLGLYLGVDYSHTWSCYRGGALACGKCATCVERLTAFKLVGVPDPLEYA